LYGIASTAVDLNASLLTEIISYPPRLPQKNKVNESERKSERERERERERQTERRRHCIYIKWKKLTGSPTHQKDSAA